MYRDIEITSKFNGRRETFKIEENVPLINVLTENKSIIVGDIKETIAKTRQTNKFNIDCRLFAQKLPKNSALKESFFENLMEEIFEQVSLSDTADRVTLFDFKHTDTLIEAFETLDTDFRETVIDDINIFLNNAKDKNVIFIVRSDSISKYIDSSLFMVI